MWPAGILLCSLFLAAYGFLACIVLYGWHRSRRNPGEINPPGISLLIPLRNEENNLPALLHDLTSLDYPPEKLEILFIDDHSSDHSVQILRSAFPLLPFSARLLELTSDARGKRAALIAGIESARFEHILITDSDCRVQASWLQAMTHALYPGCRLVCGPVMLSPASNLLDILQQVEWLPVMTITGGFAGAEIPVMANGANMLFLKKDYAGFLASGYKPTSTGDDTWFLHYLKNKSLPIVFARSRDAIVSTLPCADLKSFLQQRTRWTSKSRYYRDPLLLLLGTVLGTVNMICLLLPVLVLVNPSFSGVAISWFVLKISLDAALTVPAARFFGLGARMLYLPLLALLYPVYTLYLVLSQLSPRFHWKQRSYPLP